MYKIFQVEFKNMNTRGIRQNSHVRILLEDQRVIVGTLLACDPHMNTLVTSSIEFKKNFKKKQWQKRILGLCMIRGNSITSISLDAADQPQAADHP